MQEESLGSKPFEGAALFPEAIDQNDMLIQDQNPNQSSSNSTSHPSEKIKKFEHPSLPSLLQESHMNNNFDCSIFDDDHKYYESVSVDLEQEEFNKL